MEGWTDAGRDLALIVDGATASQSCTPTNGSFFHLHQLRPVHILVRAAVHGRLDYCNALFAGLSGNSLRH